MGVFISTWQFVISHYRCYSVSFSVRNSSFKLGSDVELTCGNQTWTKTVFVVWSINLTIQPKLCKIALDIPEKGVDTCRDGKSLRNTSSGQLYLHIPNFSNKDVGIYKCESIYNGGNDGHYINVNIIGKNSSMVVFLKLLAVKLVLQRPSLRMLQ